MKKFCDAPQLFHGPSYLEENDSPLVCFLFFVDLRQFREQEELEGLHQESVIEYTQSKLFSWFYSISLWS